MARLFIAIDLNDDLRAALDAAIAELSRIIPGTKWVRPESMHLTIRFLGDMPVEAISAVEAAMAPVLRTSAAFDCRVEGIGVFPNVRRPSVIWAGITQGEQPLRGFAKQIREALAWRGFDEDTHPFSAHVTLGRMRRGARIRRQRLSDILQTWERRRFGMLSVRQLILYKSTLTPAGAIHEPLRTWGLQTP